MGLSFSFALAILLVLCVGTSMDIAFAEGHPPAASQPAVTQSSPQPALSPKAVTRIIVDALGNNDAQNNGIRTTWKFTSPQNQQVTGPIERFIPMIKNAAYQPMLNHTHADIKELAVDQNKAAELVTITGADGSKAYYIFQLSKQGEGELKDCWLTDGVVRVQPGEGGNAPVKPQGRLPDGQFPA